MYASFLIRSAIFFLLAFSLFGCGKADLSRSSAKGLIQGSLELKALSQNVRLNFAAEGKARALDVLSSNGTLTPKGAKLFSRFSYAEAILAQPISLPDVDVTGITSVPMTEDMKEVQFNLAFQYPPAIKRYAAKVGGGVAHFRRYDDGWRLESVNISASNEPYPLTAQDVSDEQAEVSAVASEERFNQRYLLSTDGDEVTDKETGLTWRRCAEGMVYRSGTCTKTAREFNHDEAMQHAVAEARRTGKAWRVPGKDDLASIVDPSFLSMANPSPGMMEIDPTAFPATPICGFWTASLMAGESEYAWAISFGGAIETGYSGTEGHYCVRLVRTGQ